MRSTSSKPSWLFRLMLSRTRSAPIRTCLSSAAPLRACTRCNRRIILRRHIGSGGNLSHLLTLFCTFRTNRPRHLRVESMVTISAKRVYTTAEARDRFSEVVNEASYGSKRVLLTRHGKSVAAVVSVADLEL